MKRFTKICLWTCGICILAGVVLMAVGWGMGFRGYHPRRSEELEIEERYEAVEGDIRNLEFEVGSGRLVIEEGDAFAVTAASVGSRYESRVEHGTWILEEDEDPGRGSSIGGFYIDNTGVYSRAEQGEVHITIPAGAQLDHVEIQVDNGAADIGFLRCNTLEIEVDSGFVDLLADVSKAIMVECETGRVMGSLLGEESDFNLDMHCNLGSVTVGTYEFGAVVGGDRWNRDGSKQMTVSCDIGSVEFDFPEEDLEDDTALTVE